MGRRLVGAQRFGQPQAGCQADQPKAGCRSDLLSPITGHGARSDSRRIISVNSIYFTSNSNDCWWKSRDPSSMFRVISGVARHMFM